MADVVAAGKRVPRTAARRAVATIGAAALVVALPPAAVQGQQGRIDPLQACPVEVASEDFTDRDAIPSAHLANVDCAAFFEVSLGFSDGTYGPALEIRRDQIASFIARTLESADVRLPPASEGQAFTDVGEDSPHADNIRRLEAAGIVEGGALGRDADEYGPSLPTRRDQMTSLLMRGADWAFAQEFASSGQQFDDVPGGNVHSGAVNAAAERGVVVGFAEDTFGPGHFTRRDQMASFTVRLLNLLATPAAVTASPQSAATATVGEELTVGASVSDQFHDDAGDGSPLGGEAEVTFRARHHTGNPAATSPAESQTVTAGEAGEAAFSFTAAEPGTVTVTAAVDGPGGNFAHAAGDRHRVATRFVAGPTPDQRASALSLAPGSETNVLRGDHTVRTTVTDEAGDPVEDAAVRFEVYRQAGSGHALREEGRSVTDAEGTSGFAFDGPSEPAEDTIVACVIGADDEPGPGEPFCAETTTDDGVVVAVGIRDDVVGDEATASWVRGSEPGTVAGTVTGNAGAVPGATVTFTDGDQQQTTTNLNGAYESPPLTPDVYQVAVDGYDCADEPRRVTVFAGEGVTGIDFTGCTFELF